VLNYHHLYNNINIIFISILIFHEFIRGIERATSYLIRYDIHLPITLIQSYKDKKNADRIFID
jgi:hypothetical protein